MKNPEKIKCIIFDYANTLSSDLYFKSKPDHCPEWRELFDKHIFADEYWLTEWCNGRIKAEDIALRIQEYCGLPLSEIITEMKNGCRNLALNKAVLNFAKAQAAYGRKTALVTANIDLFTDTVVPSHHLHTLFDTIINSADYGTDDKLKLWPIAFTLLGSDVNYECSLLIDDSEYWVEQFRSRGGSAYQYSDDSAFMEWLLGNQFAVKAA